MSQPEPRRPGARTKPYALFQAVFIVDIVLGAGLNLFANRLGGEDAVLVQALQLVGIGLMVAGAMGYLIMAVLARRARRGA
jgi:hypothetical protein